VCKYFLLFSVKIFDSFQQTSSSNSFSFEEKEGKKSRVHDIKEVNLEQAPLLKERGWGEVLRLQGEGLG